VELITVDVDGAKRVATVTLDAPERRNSLTMPMVHEIVEAFDDLEGRDDVGAVVVTGAPPAFCAGADLGHLG
jgi:enoyl-CoA hydratase